MCTHMAKTLAATEYVPSDSEKTPNSLLKAGIPRRLPGRLYMSRSQPPLNRTQYRSTYENSTPTMIAFDCTAMTTAKARGLAMSTFHGFLPFDKVSCTASSALLLYAVSSMCLESCTYSTSDMV